MIGITLIHSYGYKDTLSSHLKLRNLRNYNYYSFESYLFQDLRRDINQKAVPKILPRLKFDLNSDKKLNFLNFETRGEIINLKRTEGNETKSFLLIKIYYIQHS